MICRNAYIKFQCILYILYKNTMVVGMYAEICHLDVLALKTHLFLVRSLYKITIPVIL